MTEKTSRENEAVFGVDSEGQPVCVEPFARDGAPHCISMGQSRGGRTFGMQRRQLARALEEIDGENVDRSFIEVGPDGEMTEIDEIEAINPFDIPPESVAESGSQSANGESNL